MTESHPLHDKSDDDNGYGYDHHLNRAHHQTCEGEIGELRFREVEQLCVIDNLGNSLPAIMKVMVTMIGCI